MGNEIPNVRRVGTDVFFYDEITPKTALAFAEEMQAAATEAIGRELHQGVPRPPIIVHINSGGGGVYPCLGMVESIRSMQVRGLRVETIVEGYAASAATVVAAAGSHCRMGRDSTMLVHQVRGNLWSTKTADLRDEADNWALLESIIKRMYLKRWRGEPAELDALIQRERLLAAEECLRLGLVDEVL